MITTYTSILFQTQISPVVSSSSGTTITVRTSRATRTAGSVISFMLLLLQSVRTTCSFGSQPRFVDSVPTPKVAPNLTCLLRVSQSVAPPSPTNSLVSCSRRDCTDQLVKKARKMCTESSMKDAFSTYSDYLNNFLSFFPLFPVEKDDSFCFFFVSS